MSQKNLMEKKLLKLITVSVDLSKLSNAGNKRVVENTAYNELVRKVNAIQTIATSNLVKKADDKTKIIESEMKIPDHDKHITTTEFDKLMKNNLARRLKQAYLAKNDIANFLKKRKTNKL